MLNSGLRLPWLALGVGTAMALIVARFGVLAAPETRPLPLLLLLLMAEFGALLALAGSISAIRALTRHGFAPAPLLVALACAALAIALALLGLALWPGGAV